MEWSEQRENGAWVCGDEHNGAGVTCDEGLYYYNIIKDDEMIALGVGPFTSLEAAKTEAEQRYSSL